MCIFESKNQIYEIKMIGIRNPGNTAVSHLARELNHFFVCSTSYTLFRLLELCHNIIKI
jgi:hypothetical protein